MPDREIFRAFGYDYCEKSGGGTDAFTKVPFVAGLSGGILFLFVLTTNGQSFYQLIPLAGLLLFMAIVFVASVITYFAQIRRAITQPDASSPHPPSALPVFASVAPSGQTIAQGQGWLWTEGGHLRFEGEQFAFALGRDQILKVSKRATFGLVLSLDHHTPISSHTVRLYGPGDWEDTVRAWIDNLEPSDAHILMPPLLIPQPLPPMPRALATKAGALGGLIPGAVYGLLKAAALPPPVRPVAYIVGGIAGSLVYACFGMVVANVLIETPAKHRKRRAELAAILVNSRPGQ